MDRVSRDAAKPFRYLCDSNEIVAVDLSSHGTDVS
jgi:hypothetical protein